MTQTGGRVQPSTHPWLRENPSLSLDVSPVESNPNPCFLAAALTSTLFMWELDAGIPLRATVIQ
jgi:hypothetical protein